MCCGANSYVHMCAFCLWRPEVRELELKVAVSLLKWVLGMELRSCGRGIHVLIAETSLQPPAKLQK